MINSFYLPQYPASYKKFCLQHLKTFQTLFRCLLKFPNINIFQFVIRPNDETLSLPGKRFQQERAIVNWYALRTVQKCQKRLTP